MMNREQIIKALEFCGVGCELRNCTSECPYFAIPLEDTDDCCDVLARDACALINELTEENEKLNERLDREARCQYDLCGQIVNLRDDVKYIKANTVRRMQSDIQEACLKGGIWPAFVARVIERVGEKILEENNG